MPPRIIRHRPKIPAWLTPVIRILSFVGIGLSVLVIIWAWREGYLSDPDKMQAALSPYPILAPFIFLIIQFVQVVIPLLPGGITMPAGVMLFGPWLGLLLNYIGVCLGSLTAFSIARRFGEPLVLRIVPEHIYTKYVKKLDSRGYKRFLAIAILAPISPDDALCYLTGLSKMPFKTFAWIIILCKPWTIAVYSLVVVEGWEFTLNFLR